MPSPKALLSRLFGPSESRDLTIQSQAVAPPLFSFHSEAEPALERVTPHSALTVAHVYAAVRVLSESVSSLPCLLYRREGANLIEAVEHPLHRLLTLEVNAEMSAVTFFETVVTSLMLWGNSYSEIQRDPKGNVLGLWPLSPSQTEAYRLPNGRLSYRTTDGEKPGNFRIIASADMVHMLLMSLDGLVGLSPVQQARHAIQLSRSALDFGSSFLSRYATPQLALKTDSPVKPEDKARMREAWQEFQGGLRNRHKVAILDQGMDIKQLSISPNDAQLLEALRWSREEVAAAYRVPAHMIGSTAKISNANVVQMNLDFMVNGIRPLLSKIEAELRRKLLTADAGLSTYIVSFDERERLRGDFAGSAAGWALGRQWGWLTANDVRRDQGLNPGGPELDTYMNPLNMQDASANTTENSAEIQRKKRN